MASEKQTLRLLVLGDPGVGKTSLIRRFIDSSSVFADVPPSENKVIVHNKDIQALYDFKDSQATTITLFDSNSAIPLELPIHAVIIAFNLTDTSKSTESIKQWVYRLIQKDVTVPIFLVGAKFDVAKASLHEIHKHFREISELLSNAYDHSISYIGCTSAKDSANNSPLKALNNIISNVLGENINTPLTINSEAINCAVIGSFSGSAIGIVVFVVALLVVASLPLPPDLFHGTKDIMKLTTISGATFVFLSTLLGAFLGYVGYVGQKAQQKEEAMPSSPPPTIDDDNKIECVNWDDYHSQLTQAPNQISEESGYSDLLIITPGKDAADGNAEHPYPAEHILV